MTDHKHWMISRMYENFRMDNHDLCMNVSDVDYSYAQIAERISALQELVLKHTANSVIGIVATDSHDTYAAIIACWFCGKGYVPIHPRYPVERNQKVIREVGIDLILSSTDNWASFIPEINGLLVHCTNKISGRPSTCHS